MPLLVPASPGTAVSRRPGGSARDGTLPGPGGEADARLSDCSGPAYHAVWMSLKIATFAYSAPTHPLHHKRGSSGCLVTACHLECSGVRMPRCGAPEQGPRFSQPGTGPHPGPLTTRAATRVSCQLHWGNRVGIPASCCGLLTTPARVHCPPATCSTARVQDCGLASPLWASLGVPGVPMPVPPPALAPLGDVSHVGVLPLCLLHRASWQC